MKLRDFIALLSEYDGDLPVVLFDWNECFAVASERAATGIDAVQSGYTNEQGEIVEGEILLIGDDSAIK